MFPLPLRHTNSYATKLVVVIGDAAHTVHPLTAQGVNLRIALGTGWRVKFIKKYEREKKRQWDQRDIVFFSNYNLTPLVANYTSSKGKKNILLHFITSSISKV